MAMVWLVVRGVVVAAGGAVRASAGSRRWSCSYSGAGPRPLFVARPLSKVERGRPGAGAQATDRGVGVREPGMLGPPRQPQPGQRLLMSLVTTEIEAGLGNQLKRRHGLGRWRTASLEPAALDAEKNWPILDGDQLSSSSHYRVMMVRCGLWPRYARRSRSTRMS